MQAAVVGAACSSCLVSSVKKAGSISLFAAEGSNHRLHSTLYRDLAPHNNAMTIRNIKSNARAAFFYIALRQLSTNFGCNVFTTTNIGTAPTKGLYFHSPEHHYHQHHGRFSFAKSSGSIKKEHEGNNGVDENTEQNVEGSDYSKESSPKVKDNISSSMVGAIGIYKNFISPLLPPACRFLPTCSQYGVQAIEEFGPTKGAILTAWRLMRCSPLGGRGYDPPKWPPVSYTHGSY